MPGVGGVEYIASVQFGARLRTVREALGLTLATVAARAGMSEGNLSRIERGQNCSLTTAIGLARAVGVDLAALVRSRRRSA